MKTREKVGAMALGITYCGLGGLAVNEVFLDAVPVVRIDSESFPDEMPRAVAIQSDKVVTVVSLPPNGEGYMDEYRGSGVQIDADSYLSAGHVAVVGEEESKTSSCPAISLVMASNQSGRNAVQHEEKHVATFNKDDHAVPDVMLVETPQKEVHSPQVLPTVINRDKIQFGDKLYAINYQTTQDGEMRSPRPVDIFGRRVGKVHKSPARWGAVVIPSKHRGLLAVVTGVKEYDTESEGRMQRAGSGGPVFDAEGELVGMTVLFAPKLLSIQELRSTYNVKAKGDLGARYRIAYVQRITPKLLESYEEKLTATDRSRQYGSERCSD